MSVIRYKSNRQQTGFTLIEVLIALFIFSIGLLGLAGLQLRAIQSNQYAHMRTMAALQANSLADRMRANATGVDNGNYTYNSTSDTVTANSTCMSTGCSSSDMAATDLANWKAELDNLLPGAETVVCQDSDPEIDPGANAPGGGIVCDADPDVWTIYIDWQDQKNLDQAATQRFTLTFIP